jgi:alpha-L-rhamnosidase
MDIMSTMYNLKLLCEYNENPLGVDNKTPCFSWLLQDAPQNAAQSAFRISVSSMAVGGADMWDSGKVKSTESAFIPYAGKALKSRTRYFWRLWLWDESGAEAGVSETAWFETAFMDEKEWQAKWIGLSRLSSNPERRSHPRAFFLLSGNPQPHPSGDDDDRGKQHARRPPSGNAGKNWKVQV